jgi:hypothetical protein
MFVVTKEKSVRLRDVTGVFDLDSSTVSSVTKNFLSAAEKNGEIEGTNNLPKSFILINSGGKNRIYFSSRLSNYINHSLSAFQQF